MKNHIRKIIATAMLSVIMVTQVSSVKVKAETRATPLEIWTTATDGEFWKQTYYLLRNVLGYSVTADIDNLEESISNYGEYMASKGLVRDGLLKVDEDGKVTLPDELMDATREYLYQNTHENTGIFYLVTNPQTNFTHWQNSYLVDGGYLGPNTYKQFKEMVSNGPLLLQVRQKKGTSWYYTSVIDLKKVLTQGGIYLKTSMTSSKWNEYMTSTYTSGPSIYFGTVSSTGAVTGIGAEHQILGKYNKSTKECIEGREEDDETWSSQYAEIVFKTSQIEYSTSTSHYYRFAYYGNPIPVYRSDTWMRYYMTGQGGEFASNKFINYDYDIDNSVKYDYTKIEQTNWENVYNKTLNNITNNIQNIVVNGDVVTGTEMNNQANKELEKLLQDLIDKAGDIEDGLDDVEDSVGDVEEDVEESNSWLQKIYKKLKEMVSYFVDGEFIANIKARLDNIIDLLTDIKGIGIVGGSDGESQKNGILDWILGLIGGAITGIFDLILGIFRALGDAIISIFTNVIQFFTQGLTELISGLFNSLKIENEQAEVGEVQNYFQLVNGIYEIIPGPLRAGMIISFVALVVGSIIKYLL